MASVEETITFSTEAFDYTLRGRVHNYDQFTFDEPCVLVDTFLANVDYVRIPCFKCSGFSNLDAYIGYYRREITNMVLSKYFYLPRSFVNQMAHSFALFLENVDCDYVCPNQSTRESGISYVLQIEPLAEEEMAIRESFDALAEEEMVIRESFDEAAPVMKPATLESVEGLLALSLQQQFECGECVICIDRIETSETALTMPCSHVFHRDCLVQWLENSHVCPLCRYEMPAADLH